MGPPFWSFHTWCFEVSECFTLIPADVYSPTVSPVLVTGGAGGGLWPKDIILGAGAAWAAVRQPPRATAATSQVFPVSYGSSFVVTLHRRPAPTDLGGTQAQGRALGTLLRCLAAEHNSNTTIWLWRKHWMHVGKRTFIFSNLAICKVRWR